MSHQRATKYRVGLFVIATAGILVFVAAFLGVFGTGKRPYRYYVRFQGSVVGLRKRASQVLYRGVPVGIVADIGVNPLDPKFVIAEIDIEPAFAVTKGMEAYIIITDLTGIRSIELRGGTRGDKIVSPGGDINGAPQIFEQMGEVADALVQKSEKTLDSVNAVLDKDNRQRFSKALGSVSQIAGDLEGRMKQLLSEENMRHVDNTVANASLLSTESVQLARKISGGVEQIQSDVGRTLDSARSLMEDPAVSEAIKSASALVGRLNELTVRLTKTVGEAELQRTAADARALLKELGSLSHEAAGLLGNVNGLVTENRAEIRRTVTNLRLASDNLREVTLSLRSNPSALIRSAPARDREVR